ncbi:uncharacterized protein BP5553_10248 [Venustampulla echinocandica]|uniref:Uncharacterized protein n=1 Tax=Venustampulla echinocandica TaxID=2656787 RepID=A0A370T9N6_9HELO|nr:uncharacterized protein BP5553_10248 [Venustampulla echinocandica]RDL30370.1 hypothetical protein BP5553_10248 [Venustampulla echinocandica]
MEADTKAHGALGRDSKYIPGPTAPEPADVSTGWAATPCNGPSLLLPPPTCFHFHHGTAGTNNATTRRAWSAADTARADNRKQADAPAGIRGILCMLCTVHMYRLRRRLLENGSNGGPRGKRGDDGSQAQRPNRGYSRRSTVPAYVPALKSGRSTRALGSPALHEHTPVRDPTPQVLRDDYGTQIEVEMGGRDNSARRTKKEKKRERWCSGGICIDRDDRRPRTASSVPIEVPYLR